MVALPLKAEPDLVRHLGFLISEEEALKTYLEGLTIQRRPLDPVPQPRDDIGVWFRWPEGERQIKYPYITIDLISLEPEYALFHSDHVQKNEGLYQPSVSPRLPPLPTGRGYEILNYLPMRLVWQVSHFARSALHDRYLTSIFATDVFPPRPFFIYNPADGVDRRTEVLSMVSGDTMETTESGTKRIFRKIYTISMLSEIPQQRLASTVVYTALRVLIPVVDREQFDSYFYAILNGHPDPLEEFTAEERANAGEFFHVFHEGLNIPPP